jgi:hypothetical protein
MEQFRRGDTLDIKLVVRNKVGINDGYIFFVNEEDSNAHIYWGFHGKEGVVEPVPPNPETTFWWEKTIEEDQKLGVYTLEEVNFKTFEGTTVDAPFPMGAMKFEVVQDLEEGTQSTEEDQIDMEEVDAPITILELSVLRKLT